MAEGIASITREQFDLMEPSDGNLRPGDGRWHGILTYRVMDTGELAGAAPAPHTGLYVEEVISRGPEAPVWRFA